MYKYLSLSLSLYKIYTVRVNPAGSLSCTYQVPQPVVLPLPTSARRPFDELRTLAAAPSSMADSQVLTSPLRLHHRIG